MRWMKLTMMILLATSVGSCSTQAGQQVSRTAANVVLPPPEEEQLGDQMAAEIEREMQIVEGTEVAEYVDTMGRNVVRVAGDIPEGIDFDFHVVKDDETINAFAIPGGHIYVTTGLLKEAENESEVTAVLAHEVAHVTQRHIAERLAVQFGVSTLASIALGQGGGTLAQLVTNIAANGYLLKYSRDDEREADRVGMGYLVRAGHSPYGYVTFFEKLADSPQPPEILSSHPHPEERVTNARREIARYRENVIQQPTYEARYRERTASL